MGDGNGAEGGDRGIALFAVGERVYCRRETDVSLSSHGRASAKEGLPRRNHTMPRAEIRTHVSQTKMFSR